MSKRAPYPAREPWPGSPQYWRSLEERAQNDSGKKESVAPVEFAKGHVSTPPTDEAWELSRRGLLGAMAATLSLVGAEG